MPGLGGADYSGDDGKGDDYTDRSNKKITLSETGIKWKQIKDNKKRLYSASFNIHDEHNIY